MWDGGYLGRKYLGNSVFFIYYVRGYNMPLFNGPIVEFLRKHGIVRRAAFWGGALVGLYFLGASQGWWNRFLF